MPLPNPDLEARQAAERAMAKGADPVRWAQSAEYDAMMARKAALMAFLQQKRSESQSNVDRIQQSWLGLGFDKAVDERNNWIFQSLRSRYANPPTSNFLLGDGSIDNLYPR